MLGMWDVGDVGCLGWGLLGMCGMWDVGDVGCWGCGMFGMGDLRDAGCMGCRMWDVWDVGCAGCGMLIYKMPSSNAVMFRSIYYLPLKPMIETPFKTYR